MAFLADQYAGEKGCWVEFFGRPASVHKAIALLALEHEALVAVCTSPRWDRPMRFEMNLEAIADPRRRGDAARAASPSLTQWYTSATGSGHPPPSAAILVAASALEGRAEARRPAAKAA